MAYFDVLYERPGVTGVILGGVLRTGSFVVDNPQDVVFVAFLLFAFGTVAAIWADNWWRPAGQALSVAGGFVILVVAVEGLVQSVT